MDEVKQAIRDIQHFGEEGGVIPVIDVASTSTFLDPEDMEKVFRGELEGRYLYSRHSNPTGVDFGKKLAALEEMEDAVGVASGMAAISCSLLQLVPNGGHIVCSQTIYGGTYALLKNIFPRMGIAVTFVDPNDVRAFERAIRPETKVLYTETVSNPLLGISDLKAIGALAKKRGLKLVVDNTFTPAVVTPSRYGADVVIHSCTKYISGASDLVAGAIISSKDFIHQLVDLNGGMAMLLGPVMDSRISHKLYLRLDHLPLRMTAHSRSAGYLAVKMEEAGVKVIYPGLKSHPQHELMKSMMHPEYGFGGMITVDCGTREKAFRLASRLQEEKFGLYAVSLGFSRTLMSCPAVSTSSEIPAEDQEKMHLSPGLLRLSIGFTGNDKVMSERFFKCYHEVFG